MVVTDEGPAVGCVFATPQNVGGKGFDQNLKKIFRLATQEEINRYESDCNLEKEVYEYCHLKVKERAMPMRLVSVERRFDGSKMIVYFTADGRVDFRQLVKDLVGKFKTRIEMRQIGVRHQAKMVGGLGTCGRPLCCTSFLSTFDPVTIKMAKKQNISLNPNKISGMCGRLMCCLTYEHEYYEKIKKNFPKIGKRIMTSEGEGKVIRQNVLKETVTVALDSGTEVEVPVNDLQGPFIASKEALFRRKKAKKE
jgi:cell fate regulator YaaT (PSP1 superfamily)